MDRQQLANLCKKYNKWLQEQEYQKISSDLEKTDIGKASVLELTSKLRYSCCRFYKIPAWIWFRTEVKEELIRRGEDWKQILMGLFDVKEEKPSYTKTFEHDILGLKD